MNGQTISRIIERVVKDKKGKELELFINDLKVDIKENFAVIDIDISVGKVFGSVGKVITNILSSPFPSPRKKLELFLPKVHEYLRGHGFAVEININSFNASKNGSITRMKGNFQVKSNYLSEFLSDLLNKNINKTGLEINVKSVVFNPLSIKITEKGNVFIDVKTNVVAKCPGVEGDLSIKSEALLGYIKNKIIETIKNSFNAEISMNINLINITSVNNDIAIALSANAEISDAALSSIFEKVYR